MQQLTRDLLRANSVEALRQFSPHEFVGVIHTGRGDIPAVFSVCEGAPGAVVWLCQEDMEGPAGGVYAELARDLVAEGISSVRIAFRRPEAQLQCVADAMSAVTVLRSLGAQRVAVVGHSFAGAVAIQSASLNTAIDAVAALSAQGPGSESIDRIAPRPVFLLHGQDDQVINASVADVLYERAGDPKGLILFEGVGHDLSECREELYDYLMSWLIDQVGVLATPGGELQP